MVLGRGRSITSTRLTIPAKSRKGQMARAYVRAKPLVNLLKGEAMKLASYNVENLFLRARAMNGETRAEGAEALANHAEMNAILSKAEYSPEDKKRIIHLMKKLGIDKKDDGG